jgi:cytidylate kinase
MLKHDIKHTITLDSLSGTGKDTVGKRVSDALAIPFFDTGAIYRLVTYFALQAQYSYDNAMEVDKIISNLSEGIVGVSFISGEVSYSIAGEKVDISYLKTPEIDQTVANYSKIPEIRKALHGWQRRVAEQELIMMAGRDIGIDIIPESMFKFYLSADIVDKSTWRTLQRGFMKNSPEWHNEFIKTFKEFAERDYKDISRETGAALPPSDATYVQNIDGHLEDTIERITTQIRSTHPKFVSE